MTVGVVVVVAVTETFGVTVMVDVTVEGFGVDVVVVAEVTVFTGTEMKELQNDVAEALYWLRTLIMTVTALHSSTFLILRSFSGAGALNAEPLNAKRRLRAVKGRMIGMEDDWGREQYVEYRDGSQRYERALLT